MTIAQAFWPLRRRRTPLSVLLKVVQQKPSTEIKPFTNYRQIPTLSQEPPKGGWNEDQVFEMIAQPSAWLNKSPDLETTLIKTANQFKALEKNDRKKISNLLLNSYVSGELCSPREKTWITQDRKKAYQLSKDIVAKAREEIESHLLTNYETSVKENKRYSFTHQINYFIKNSNLPITKDFARQFIKDQAVKAYEALQTKNGRRVGVKALCEKFNISDRTLRRYLSR